MLKNETVQLDVLRSILSFSEYSERSEALMSHDKFPSSIVKCLANGSEQIKSISIIIIGNLISCSEQFSVMLTRSGVFSVLKSFLCEKFVGTKNLDTKVWWCFENICANSPNTFYFLVNDLEIMTRMISTMNSSGEKKFHATKAFINIIMNSQRATIIRLVGFLSVPKAVLKLFYFQTFNYF